MLFRSENALAEQGFDDIETCVEPAGEQSAGGAYLVFAKRPVDCARSPENVAAQNWLLLCGVDAGTRQTAEILAQQLASSGQQVLPVTVTGQAAEYTLETLAGAREMLLLARQQLGEIHHVVDLTALGRATDSQGGDDLLERTRDRKSTRLNSSHIQKSRMPSSA